MSLSKSVQKRLNIQRGLPMDTPPKKYRHTEKWFINRIGKRLRRTGGSCDCWACHQVLNQGIYVHDERHAKYLKTCQDEIGVRYEDWK